MGKAFIEVRQVSHSYTNDLPALHPINLTIPAGSFVTLVGPSGAGKSTLLRIVGGLLRPTIGQVLLGGQPSYLADHLVGMVFQRDNLLPWRTVYDNVRLPLELRGVPASSQQSAVMELLDLVGLHGFEQNYPAQLSGGMAQRVALARALIHQPALLLLDEPFGSLDALTRERMGQELLRIWTARPVTVLMVTHSISEAVLLADQVVVISQRPGRIVRQLPVELPRPRTLEMESLPAFHTLVSEIRAAINY